MSTRDGTVTSLGIRGDTPSLAPGGWLLYSAERTVFAQRVDTRTWTLAGARREVMPAFGTG